ncbi:MAG: class I SAM-dependent methyltransferase [Microthrixaceae bacterium]|nr:class I SAM-dependent methyltransferase [Microthrixaceae bacterium]
MSITTAPDKADRTRPQNDPVDHHGHEELIPGAGLAADRVAGHWLLARLGKRVLRPGGRELTQKMLDALAVSPRDDVVELAPGMGITTSQVLAANPASYVGVDRDEVVVERMTSQMNGSSRRAVNGSASDTGLPDRCADVVFGEAYLTMQGAKQKNRILAELARISRPGARLGLHEVAFAPDDVTEADAERAAHDLQSTIKVNVTPLTIAGWRKLLDEAGFDVSHCSTAPLHLLEPRRLVADEGITGAARFVANVIKDKPARERVMSMRKAMRDNAEHLQAVTMTAIRRSDEAPS